MSLSKDVHNVVTAHDDHAIAAFEKRAADYVPKPFSSERIGEAQDVAFRRTEGERPAKSIEIHPQMHDISHKPSPRIGIKAKGRLLFINLADIVALEAQGNYVLLQHQSGSYRLRDSISDVGDRLRPYGFLRIHRSVLVNSASVEEVQALPTGEYSVRMKCGKQYTVTRTYKKNLASLAESWIGTDSFLADK